jgi:hypothetical protein
LDLSNDRARAVPDVGARHDHGLDADIDAVVEVALAAADQPTVVSTG